VAWALTGFRQRIPEERLDRIALLLAGRRSSSEYNWFGQAPGKTAKQAGNYSSCKINIVVHMKHVNIDAHNEMGEAVADPHHQDFMMTLVARPDTVIV
jgi:hypothetical protein